MSVPNIKIKTNDFDDVTKIDQNKHDPMLRNYNAGTPQIGVLINSYCPFSKGKKAETNILINPETIKSLDKVIVNSLSYVNGLPGVYLKESYQYFSNFLKINDKFIPDQTYTTTYPFYLDDQTFVVKNSVFDTPSNSPVDPFSSLVNSSTLGKGKATWMYYQDLENVGDVFFDVNGNPITNSQIKTRVNYIGQSSTSSYDSANVAGKGIHWRVEKETSLFEGQDFFITFKKRSEVPDITSSALKYFVNGTPKTETVLDALLDESGKNPNLFPTNQAVSEYAIEYEEIISGNGNKERVPKQWIKNQDTAGTYYLSNQAYYVIQVGKTPGRMFYLLICQRGNPRAIWVDEDSNSWNVGSYPISGDDLIQREKFTITVRNHLGYIVVTFDGNNNNPWIIRNKEGTETIVPADSISIWGGNLVSSFCFSPLVYKKNLKFTLPPQSPVVTPINSYEIQAKGIDKSYCLLSICDTYVDKDKFKNMYNCDAQIIKEAEITFENEVPTVVYKKSVTNPYFLNTNRFIRAIPTDNFDVQTAVTDEIKASKIELKVDSLKLDKTKEICSLFLNVLMQSGDHVFGVGSDFTTPWVLQGCKTPIINNCRILSVPSQTPSWAANPIDASELALSYSENYSAQDFHSFTHNGTIVFLVNKGMREDLDSLARKLFDLQNRAFYIDIWAGYLNCNYSKLDERNGYKLFSGICYGGIISEEAGKRIMTCQIHDYSKILQEMYIFNSPFFDGVRDFNAFYTLMQMAQFRDNDGSTNVQAGPACLIKKMAEQPIGDATFSTPDGRSGESSLYVLPQSYNTLAEPFMKFADGQNYWESMQKMTQKAGKVLFFDQYGILHYENLKTEKYFAGKMTYEQIPVLWKYTRYPDGEGQLVFETVTKERVVTDMFNVIHIISSDPQFSKNEVDEVNWDSINNPNKVGFLGYKKLFLQQESVFGSLESAYKIAQFYKRNFFTPPISYKFSSFGLPVRPFDVASIDGQKLLILSVNTTIDRAQNKWWQDIEGEFYGLENDI